MAYQRREEDRMPAQYQDMKDEYKAAVQHFDKYVAALRDDLKRREPKFKEYAAAIRLQHAWNWYATSDGFVCPTCPTCGYQEFPFFCPKCDPEKGLLVLQLIKQWQSARLHKCPKCGRVILFPYCSDCGLEKYESEQINQ